MVLALPVALTLGCTRTVLGGYSDSPDKKYRVYGRIYGAYGRSFLENTSKSVRITIVDPAKAEKILLRKQYQIKGSNVGWHALWDEQNNLKIVLFEYPPGVNRWDINQKAVPTNQIRSITFRCDRQMERFIEVAQEAVGP